ncbi:MAG: class II D-tagatose-bisphosphate aldolase, non-catalytic subunit [Desulfobacterales bacterium]|jgi:D-tagatose-1,6-bisphosphate aldolase subunit GatZ/KbaZ
MVEAFLTFLNEMHRTGKRGGLVAVCSSHPTVIREAAAVALQKGLPLLVEATANQVNQTGGYTGLTPKAFSSLVHRTARQAGLPKHRVLLGADHLSPSVWSGLPAGGAVQEAAALARLCVAAGFDKIHLDTARPCADDPESGVSGEMAARRAAALCRAAEEAAAGFGGRRPVYVIGDEVPPPGGGLQEGQPPTVTSPEAVAASIRRHDEAFRDAGLGEVWQRVAAVVVQPGVEFNDRSVARYSPDAARSLSRTAATLPGHMCFEVHAADYQGPEALARMARDRFPVIKIGPSLTFCYREALYALALLEEEMPGLSHRSDLRKTMESLMQENPSHWRSHYRGDAATLRFLRHYSLRDRIRYYWHLPPAKRAVGRLMANLHRPVPAALIRQFLPDQQPAAGNGSVPFDPERFVSRRMRQALSEAIEAVSFPDKILCRRIGRCA